LLLTEAYGREGETKEELNLWVEALVAVPRNRQHDYAVKLRQLKGELLLVRSVEHHTEVEACFQ
jgi:hypothetical protein